jgi:hypothetical protein
MTRLNRVHALSFVALAALVGCSSAGASARPSLPADAERTVVPRTYTAGGITLAVPGSKAPAVDARGAYHACISGVAACPDGAPSFVELSSVTDDQYGDANSKGTVTHPIRVRLSWVFTWQGIACPPRLGPTPPDSAVPAAATCDWLVIVDAESGESLVTYAGPPIK